MLDVQFLGIWVYIITTLLLMLSRGLHVHLAIALYAYGTSMIVLPMLVK